MNNLSPAVLAAEDEESDRFLLRTAFERAGVSHPLVLVNDGQEAVDFLTAAANPQAGNAGALPGLVLLDIKMPRMNGLEVLYWLAERPEFKNVPAVILSSSSQEADMQMARQLGARDYLVKPFGLPALVRLVQDISARWLTPLSTNQ
jgi:CheY-like chemotaxis protein